MLRRTLVALAVTLAALVAFGGAASADVGYGAPGVVSLNVPAGDESVDSGEAFDLIGDGFDPGETVDVVGTYGVTPSGLRSARALSLRSSPLSYVVTADSNGHFLISPVSYDEAGTITFVATGRSSGKSATRVVQVGSAGTSTTTIAAAASGWSGSADNSGSNLAFTGASVIGPIAIGLAALLAGLALLFFGTRGVIRHKGARTTPTI